MQFYNVMLVLKIHILVHIIVQIQDALPLVLCN